MLLPHSIAPSRLALDWPTVVVLAVALFLLVAPELEFLLPFIKKLKIGAAEVELREKIEELAVSVQRSEESVPVAVPKDEAGSRLFSLFWLDQSQRLVGTGIEAQILNLAAKDKQAALIRLSIELEREVLLLHGMLGLRNNRRPVGFRRAVEQLRERGTISSEMANSLLEFWQVRNQIIHAQFSIDEPNPILNSALDSGIRLLRLIRAIPRPIYRVLNPKVILYSDKGCKERITDYFGVLVETTNTDGRKLRQVLPAGRPFTKGEVVGWDWDLTRQYERAFYENPESGEPTLAWDSSAAFVGRTEHVKE